jgi:hypothetical protein
MGKQFSGNGFACSGIALRCSFSVRIATADSATAVSLAATKHDCGSGVRPIVDTSGVRKAGWTIVTGSGNIGDAAARKPA